MHSQEPQLQRAYPSHLPTEHLAIDTLQLLFTIVERHRQCQVCRVE